MPILLQNRDNVQEQLFIQTPGRCDRAVCLSSRDRSKNRSQAGIAHTQAANGECRTLFGILYITQKQYMLLSCMQDDI